MKLCLDKDQAQILSFGNLAHEVGIDDEENLPTSVDEINNDIIDGTPDDAVNANQDIDNK